MISMLLCVGFVQPLIQESQELRSSIPTPPEYEVKYLWNFPERTFAFRKAYSVPGQVSGDNSGMTRLRPYGVSDQGVVVFSDIFDIVGGVWCDNRLELDAVDDLSPNRPYRQIELADFNTQKIRYTGDLMPFSFVSACSKCISDQGVIGGTSNALVGKKYLESYFGITFGGNRTPEYYEYLYVNGKRAMLPSLELRGYRLRGVASEGETNFPGERPWHVNGSGTLARNIKPREFDLGSPFVSEQGFILVYHDRKPILYPHGTQKSVVSTISGLNDSNHVVSMEYEYDTCSIALWKEQKSHTLLKPLEKAKISGKDPLGVRFRESIDSPVDLNVGEVGTPAIDDSGRIVRMKNYVGPACAYDINNSSTVVGRSFDENGVSRAVSWTSEAAMKLASHKDFPFCRALRISNEGTIVGDGWNPEDKERKRVALVWRGGGVFRLDQCAPELKTRVGGVIDISGNGIVLVSLKKWNGPGYALLIPKKPKS